MDIHGVGPAGAARILADVGDIARFADRNRFASWTGTAPLDASSGEQIRHRLSRAGNRRMNHVLHIAAIVQLRNDTPGRAYYLRKIAAGKTRWKRCAASNAGCPTWCTASWSPTPEQPSTGRGRGSGRALRGVTSIQRGRPAPAHRHFGSATSRTRTHDATRAQAATKGPCPGTPPAHHLTQRGAICGRLHRQL